MTRLALGAAVRIPIHRRSIVVGSVMVLALGLLSALAMLLGPYPLTPDLLPAAFADDLPAKVGYTLDVVRLPRLLLGIAVGWCFGLSGSLLQTVTRNPLGSPDVIGIGQGAAAGAAVFGLLLPGILPLPVGALLGALLALVIVYFGSGSGFRMPGRMIIVGIGVSAMAISVVQFIVARTQRESATSIAAWTTGSLAARDLGDVALVAGVAVLLLVPTLALGRRLQLIELGDDLAASVGGGPVSARVLAVLLASALAAVAIVGAGPVAFIALVAPQVARRLTRVTGPNLVNSGLTGAVLLVAADLIVLRAPLPVPLPVGVVTAALGGLYLGYLLVREWKKGSLA